MSTRTGRGVRRAALLSGGCLASALLLSFAVAAQPGGDDALAQDLSSLQGKWERQPQEWDEPPSPTDAARSVKEIKGNREMLTHYGADCKVIRTTTAEFRLEASGRVRLYTYFNWQVTAGPNKGKKIKGPFSYIYRVKDDKIYEGHDLLVDAAPDTRPKVQVWKRVEE